MYEVLLLNISILLCVNVTERDREREVFQAYTIFSKTSDGAMEG